MSAHEMVAVVAAFEASDTPPVKSVDPAKPAEPAPEESAPEEPAPEEPASENTTAPTAIRGSKKIPLGSRVVFWNDPNSPAGSTPAEEKIQTEILTYYGMESLEGEKRKEMLQALYHGTCQTHQTILQSAHCEPVRAILQTLSMRWLTKLVPDETLATLNSLNALGSLSSSSSSIWSSERSSGPGRWGSSGPGRWGSSGPGRWGSSGPGMWGSSDAHEMIPPAPYYYQLLDGKIVITTDESTRALCADLKGMADVVYDSATSISSVEASSLEKDASLMTEAVATLAHFQNEEKAVEQKALQDAEAEQRKAQEAQKQAEAVKQQALVAEQQASVAQQQAIVEKQRAELAVYEAQKQQDAVAIAAAQTALTAASTSLQTAQTELADARGHADAARAEVATAQAEVAAHATLVATAQAEAQAAREQSQRNAEAARLATGQLGALTAQHTQSTSDLAAARASLVELQALGEQVGIANRASHADAEARVQAAEARVREVEAQVAEQATRMQAERNTALAEARAQAQTNIQRLEGLLVAVQEHSAENSERKNAEIAQLQAGLDAAQADATRQAEQARVAAEHAHAAAEAEANRRQREAEDAANRQQAADASVAELNARLAQVQQNSRNKSVGNTAQINIMRQQLATARAAALSQAAAAEEAHKEAIAAAQAEAEAATRMAVAAAQADAETAAAEALQLAVESARAEVAASAAHQAEEQAARTLVEIERIQAEKTVEAQRLNAELEAARVGWQTLSSAKGASNAERNAAQAAMERIQAELASAHTQSVDTQAQLVAAQAEVASTRAVSERAVQEAQNSYAAAEIARVAAIEEKRLAEAAQAQAIVDRNAAQAEAAASAEAARVAQNEAAEQTAAATDARRQAEESTQQAEEATRRAEEAAAEVQQLNQELAAARLEVNAVGTNRTAARSEVARIQAELTSAQTQSAEAQRVANTTRSEKEQADERARIAGEAAETARTDALAAREEARRVMEQAAVNVAAIRSEKNAANAQKNLALRNATDARQAREEARTALVEAEQNKATLQAELAEARAQSEAASRAIRNSTNATQAQQEQWNQQAATAAAEQARIQAELVAATAQAAERMTAHEQAIEEARAATAAVSSERNTFQQQVTALETEKRQIQLQKEAQQRHIAQLRTNMEKRIADAEAQLEALRQQHAAEIEQTRLDAEFRAAADLVAKHDEELRQKNAAIAAAQANRNEQIAAAQANRNATRMELNTAQRVARAEQERLLAEHQTELEEADKERRSLSEQYVKALAEGNTAHANELQQQRDDAEQAHQQAHQRALQDVMDQATTVVKEHSAVVEAEKKEREAAFEKEKDEWEAQMAEVEKNNLLLTSESRAAKDQAAIAKREKEEAIAAAQEAAATAIATAQAAEQAAQRASATNRTNKETALTAQRKAEIAAEEAREKQMMAEAAVATATTYATEQQTIASAAQEAAQRATADAAAAQAAQAALETQQKEMKRDADALRSQLAAATNAQEVAQQALAAKVAQNVQNNIARQTASDEEKAEWARQMQEQEDAISEAREKADAEKAKAEALQVSLDAKSAAYDKAVLEAERELNDTKAATETAMQAIEARHRQEIQNMTQTIAESTQRVEQISQEIATAKAESVSIQEQMRKEHTTALSQKNNAHAAVLQEQASALQIKMDKLENDQAEALKALEREKETAVAALQRNIASHEANIAELTAQKEDAERKQATSESTVAVKEQEIAQLNERIARYTEQKKTSNYNTTIQLQNAIEISTQLRGEATEVKQKMEEAILLNKNQLASAMQHIRQITTEKVDLERQLSQVTAAVTERLGVINLSAVPSPNVSFQPVSHEAVTGLIDDLTRLYFLPWRTLLRQPVALRAYDLREAQPDSLSPRVSTCLQRYPLTFLFSPLPNEQVMRSLLGEAYEEYEAQQVNVSSASSSSSSSNSVSSSASSATQGGGGNAMRIDTLLYYLIMGLRQAPIDNSSAYMDVVNATVAGIKDFHREHFERNKANLTSIQQTCTLELTDEHNKDPSLLTFLYLSSKTPTLKNARFKYTIDPRSKRSLEMTYSSTPTPFYQGKDEIAQGANHKTYHYGPFTKIYEPTMNSQSISQDRTFVDAVENKLRRGEAVTVIGYGASGSGKTTTLVYAKHNGEPGLLAHVANRLITPTQVGGGFTSCQVIIYELDADGSPNGQCRAFTPASQKKITRTVLDKEGKATTYEIPVTDCSNATPFSYTIQEGRWANASSRIPLEREIVEYIDTKRNTAPTPNNPQSSRSHVICVLTFSRSEAKAVAQDKAVFIVCDFAGVENTFMCEDPRVRETIGVKALVDPMVDHVLRKVEADIRKNIREIADQDLVLTEKASSYLFGKQSIMDTFTMIRNGCNDMYRKMDREFGKSVSTLTDYTQISIDSYRHNPHHDLASYHVYAPVYQRMLDLYHVHVDSSFQIIYPSVHQLVKLLVWYTHSRARFQTLFQSLVTREYDPQASAIMTKTQIEAYSKEELCNQRVKEGVFINQSLAQLRAFISASVRGKTRNPPFLDECVPLQCDPNHLHCFGQDSRNTPVNGGPLTALIQTHAPERNTFCIFTVVNLSLDANNPPPTPYVDIGPLLIVREALQPLLPGNSGSSTTIKGALDHIGRELQYVGLQDTLFQEFQALYTKILKGSHVPYYLEELLQKLISHNAITTIGTIEFTDTMAKYGATQITCQSSFVKGEVKKREPPAAASASASSASASTPVSASTSIQRPMKKQSTNRIIMNPQTGQSVVYEQTPSIQSVTPQRGIQSIPTYKGSLGGRMPTRVRRKVNRRTRKKRSA